ncbi:hypothetical protein AALC75_13715 [Lachnospiraceae bacterium 48-42]
MRISRLFLCPDILKKTANIQLWAGKLPKPNRNQTHVVSCLNRRGIDTAFRERVKKSGISQEAYVRPAITGRTPRDAPPPDYYSN